MTSPWQASLFVAPAPPSAKPDAPAGIKRAAKAASRVDLAVLHACRMWVGLWVTERDFSDSVDEIATCGSDTPRRRRDALQAQGLIQTERDDKRPGWFRVLAVREAQP